MSKKPLFLLLFVLAFACQKEISSADDTGIINPKCRLTKIIQGTHDGLQDDTTITFAYNDAGRLEKVNIKQLDFDEDFVLHYDNKDRLIQVNGFIGTNFVYNDRGLLSEITYLMFSDSSKDQFVYGSGDLPLEAKHLTKSNGQWEELWGYRYSFQNGNMVMREIMVNGAPRWTEYYEYHDAIPNVLKEYSLLSINNNIPLGLFEEFLFFNKNLLKKFTYDNSAYYVDYKMDSESVAHSTFTWMSMPGYDSTTREAKSYFYDCK